jgi:hypothetical protein
MSLGDSRLGPPTTTVFQSSHQLTLEVAKRRNASAPRKVRFLLPRWWAGDIKAQEWDFRRRLPKVLNSTEDAHLNDMSTFAADQHLQALM